MTIVFIENKICFWYATMKHNNRFVYVYWSFNEYKDIRSKYYVEAYVRKLGTNVLVL